MKLLIIEDDTGLNRGISFAMEQEGYEVVSARTLREGETLFGKEKPDAIILDLNLPDGDGLDFCKKVRQWSGAAGETAILMLTARDLETDESMGLTNGADECLSPPFSVSVLKIRLQNILRRKADSPEEEYKITSGDVTLDLRTFRVFCQGEELDLSMTEFRLLQFFMENKNRALLKEQILQRVWDVDGNYVEENTLSVNISRLRRKLGSDHIRTIQGIGYLWEEKA